MPTDSNQTPRELEAFIDLVERSGVRVAVVSGGDYDLTTPEEGGSPPESSERSPARSP